MAAVVFERDCPVWADARMCDREWNLDEVCNMIVVNLLPWNLKKRHYSIVEAATEGEEKNERR
jgi:hypothetical protein